MIDAPLVPARWFTKGPRRNPIDLVVVHTMEAAEKGTTAEAVAKYFSTLDRKASAHWCIDADSEVRSVRDEDIAYHAPGASHRSIGLEHAGYAKQTPAEWADEYSTRMLERSARICADICRTYGIPVVLVDAAGVKAGRAGITTHAAVTQAYPDKGNGHWDPGPGFPMARYLEMVRSHLEPRVPDLPKPKITLASEATTILGAPGPTITVDQAVTHLADGTTPYTAVDLRTIVDGYFDVCSRVGLDPAIPLGQLCVETGPELEAKGQRGPLTSQWSQRPYRNPAGIGVTGQHAAGSPDRAPATKLPVNHVWMWHPVRDRWEAGISFPNWAVAAEAHVGRLLAYVLRPGAATPAQQSLIDVAGRWRVIPGTVRGSTITLAHLGRAKNPSGVGWATGPDYGAKIATQINRVRAR